MKYWFKKFLLKIKILVKNQKRNFWPKNEICGQQKICGQKTKIVVKKRKLWSKTKYFGKKTKLMAKKGIFSTNFCIIIYFQVRK